MFAPEGAARMSKLADTRSRELVPVTIHSYTSCRGTTSISAGDPTSLERPAEAGPPRRSRHAATLLGSPCGGAPCGASGREPLRVPRTARFRAPPAACHPLSRMVPTNQASCAALIAQRRLSHPARLGHDLLAQAAFPGPRVASPDDPRRTSRSAAPEVHSVAELPPFTTLDLRPEPLLGQDVIHSL